MTYDSNGSNTNDVSRWDLLELDLPTTTAPPAPTTAPPAPTTAPPAPTTAPIAPPPAPAAVADPLTATWRGVDGGWYLLLPRGAGRPGQIVRAQTRGGQTTYHRLASVIRVEPQGGPEIWTHVASSAAAAREEQRAAPAPAAPVARTVTSYSAPIEIEQIRPAAAAAAPVTADLPTPGALTGGNLIAGAAAEGHGALVWWSGSAVGGGRGEITRATLLGALGAAEALDWAPAPRSAQAHAATAARVAANGAAVRATPVPQIDSGRCDRLGAVIYRPATPEERGWLARWTIAYLSGTGQIGDSAGSVAGVVELAPDGQTVVATGPTADRVQAEYQRLTGGEVYQAGEVTAWLGQRIVAAGGVRLGPGYYVPARSRAQVTRVADALSAVWGSSWLTGLPVATSEQMLAGLAGGLAAEVTEIVAEVDGVGPRGAATLLRRLTEVGDRVAAYAALLGERHVATLRTTLRDAVAKVEPLLSDAARRGAMLDLS